MAQKKNKDRKENLQKFKQKIKKQMADDKAANELQKIKQYPVWASKETIEVSGLEWEAIYGVLNMFKQGIVAAESVMQRNMQNGKITMKYIDENNEEVSPDKVEEYTKQLNEFFAKKAAEEQKEKTKLVDATGSPVTSETPDAEKTDNAPTDSGASKSKLKAV